MSIDITIRRGTNVPIAFVMPDTFDMNGVTFSLSVAWPSSNRRDYTDASGLSVNAGTRTVTWSPSLADVAAFPEGKIARIELQWTRGSVQDSDNGRLTITPGISLD